MTSKFENEVAHSYAQKIREKYGKHLYHYTNDSALCGILENQTLWFGNASDMNDTKDSRDFIDRLYKEIKTSITPSFYERCDRLFQYVYKLLSSRYPYCSSLTSLNEDAAQWERYAKRASGYCIDFNTYNLSYLLYGTGVLTIHRVFYDAPIKTHSFFNLIKDYIEHDELGSFDSLDGMLQNLVYTSTLHKNISFQSEREIRILTYNKNKPYFNNVTKEINGVARDINILSLGTLCGQKGVDFEDLFNRIVIGPRSETKLEDIQSLVSSFGYSKLSQNIVVSTCPLR